MQEQISPPSPRYCQSNGPIAFICVFVKLSTNPSSRVRSWHWRLHESEIQVQGDQRFFFLTASPIRVASRLSSSSLMRWKIKINLWDQGILILEITFLNKSPILNMIHLMMQLYIGDIRPTWKQQQQQQQSLFVPHSYLLSTKKSYKIEWNC